eukprot:3486925-Rhodomonas_salina.3
MSSLAAVHYQSGAWYAFPRVIRLCHAIPVTDTRSVGCVQGEIFGSVPARSERAARDPRA